ncbi:MAG: endonuclease/exonuclease/phosphatase family metal-dependent hydrolase [Paraglaciecola sp.]|jgi:endonuclease/exonuclease/phosphatase family metal-dependent hydrolase
MRNIVKKTIKFTTTLFLVAFLYLAGILALGTYNDYQPEAVISLNPAQNSLKEVIADSTLSFLIWNIGYSGLGRESDFFLASESIYWSSIKSILPNKQHVEKNMTGITDFIKKTKADFLLLQEVDFDAKRSYFLNQFEELGKQKQGFSSFFAANYNIPQNPIPFFQPWNTYGKVHSGLATFSAYQPTESTRFQLPGDYGWPDKIFHLDRCASVHRFDTEFDKELIVINVHNSAFDKGGFLKKQQMSFLKKMITEEYEKGNYVVMGGDWNMCPADFPSNTFRPKEKPKTAYNIEKDFMPADWQWSFDPSVATIRKTTHPYLTDSTGISLIDFYLVSPNLKIEKIEGFDMDFEYSDHQPVRMEVRLAVK